MKITRTKRPDKIEITWNKYSVFLDANNDVSIQGYINTTWIPKSEIPNLIKCLEEIIK